MAARSRLLLVRSLLTAVRAATRPGAPSLAERAAALPRLVRAVRSGDYAGMTLTRLGMLGLAAAYVLSPVDLMPEGLFLVVGLADDALVLSWLAANLVNETESFLAWERGPAAPAAGWPQDAPASRWPQDAPAAGVSVPGRVVPRAPAG